jgi:hypothetical protein
MPRGHHLGQFFQACMHIDREPRFSHGNGVTDLAMMRVAEHQRRGCACGSRGAIAMGGPHQPVPDLKRHQL